MKSSFAFPLLAGIVIGIITTGVIVLARDDFFWYRNASTMNTSTTASSSTDALFIETMIPHHQSAIDMANLALTQAKTSEVKNLATSIITNQQKEIDEMTAWYKEWFGTDVETSTWSGSMMSPNGMYMHATDDLATLKSAKDFDKEFVTEMIPHHEMAIMMAQMLMRTTTRSEMKLLAQNIIDAQFAEVAEMKSWLTKWE